MLLRVSWMLTAVFVFCSLNCYAQDTPCNDTNIRLTGGWYGREGRVEVCFGGRWGTVCNNSWDTNDAAVVCRQLGITSEAPAVTQLFSLNVTVSGPILLDNVTCEGTETRLTECLHNGFGIHDCSHAHDAGVSCPGTQPYLLFVDEGYGAIYRSRLNGSGIDTLVRGLSGPVSIDFDFRQNYMFWTDVRAETVTRARLDGSEVTVVVNSGVQSDGLSVDWVNGKLYWTDSVHKHIEVYDVSTGVHRMLIATGDTTIPKAIAVEPVNRWLYWSDVGSSAKIERASMDGDGRQVLHNTQLDRPNGLSLDYQNQVLYWADAGLDKIESSNVDGSNRQLITSVTYFNAFAITFFDDVLYWSDLNADGIFSVTTAGTSVTLLIHRFSIPTGIEVVSEGRQQLGANPCAENNGGCSHLCLLSAVNVDGFTCTCPDNLVLDAGGKTCSDSHCTGEGEVRLRGGAAKEGRVEICLNNTWGTLCSSSWSDTEASVTCQQLGYSGNFAFSVNLGQGGAAVHLLDVICMGTESNLLECVDSGSGMIPVSMVDGDCSMPAGVICEAPCRSAGHDTCCLDVFGSSCFAPSESCYCNYFCPLYGDCCRDFLLVESCFGPVCNETAIRLVNGTSPASGTLEICLDGRWGLVCSDSWDTNDAAVVCRQLGFPTTNPIAVYEAQFGVNGTSDIFLDEVQCRGDETSLIECQHEGFGTHYCFSNAAGAICTGTNFIAECNDTDIRLVEGAESVNRTFGRVEICYGGTWGTVCDDFWDAADAAVVCKQLGLTSEGASAIALHSATFGRGDGPIFLDSVVCTGDESSLAECQHQGVASHDCSHSEDAGVVCPGYFAECNDTDVRLEGGVVSVNEAFGRVEICYGGLWGTVCDDFWDNVDASVVCTQIGLPSEGAFALHSATFGRGDGPIFLDNVVCMGDESSLAECQHLGIASHDCSHFEDAGVVCPGTCSDGDVRLVDQVSPTSGRVEVCFHGVWGTVCDDFWDERDASVVCRQLGLDDRGAVAVRFAQFGSGFGIIHLDNVQCDGSELRLANCTHLGVGNHNCLPSEDAGVICSSGSIERCDERRNSTFQIEENNYHFGGTCEAYQGGSTLCDGELAESVDIYFINARSVSTQAHLTSQLNAIISPVFTIASTHCQELIQKLLCLYYYTPCGVNGTLTSPVSICPEECFYVQNECTNAWNLLESLLDTSTAGLGFINCSNPGQILEPLPHCCVDAGITIPVPTTVYAFSSSAASSAATNVINLSLLSPSLLSPFLSPTTAKSSPPMIVNAQRLSTAPVATGVTVALLFLLAVLAAVVIIGLLWMRRRRKMKEANRDIPLQILSWTRRNEHAVDGDVANDPKEETSRSTGLTFENRYSLAVPGKMGERPMTPVMSRQMRELTGKMIIPSSRIRLLDTLGHGEFGIVYKAHLLPDMQITAASKSLSCPLPQTVAVKTLKGYFGQEEIKNMMDESVKMKHFNHPNVISLMGVCVDAGPAPYIVMPFMANGSLLSFLKKNRSELMLPVTMDEDDVSDTRKRLIGMCLQIAKGMEYLAEQKFVHRDLAARNCMIDLHHVIKVSDFGLTEDVYAKNYFRQGQEGGAVKLPVKWMSPESLNDGIFTEKTDVWSFGITCWEIFSGGKSPYPGVDPLSLVQLLENGRRLDKPLNAACSDSIYDIMLKCWLASADERPPFSKLVVLVSADLERQAGYLDVSSIPSASFLSENEGREKCIPPLSAMSPTIPLIVITRPDNEVEEL